MRIATWNVNSVNARVETVVSWFEEASPDVACLQEIKCVDEKFPTEAFERLGYNVAVHGQKGFNGVAILSKNPLEVTRGLPGDESDEHARYIEAVIPDGDGIILTHGAGANCQTLLLTTLADAFCEAGLTVLRCDLPFRQQRPKGPPFPAQAERDREGLRRAVEALREIAGQKVFLGGHSYGGRQATMLAAMDCFHLLGLVVVLGLRLAFLIRAFTISGSPRADH